MKRLICLFLWLLFTLDAYGAQKEIIIDNFEDGLAPGWAVRSFVGLNDYRVVPDGANQVLMSQSRGTASALYFETTIDLKEYPTLSWCWKIESTVPNGDVRSKASDDYPARIYVVFPHWFFPKTRSINYIWANKLASGEIVPSPFTANSQMVAVESGDEKSGQWLCEQRNVYQDYKRIFDEEPRQAGGVAVMTDSDNTGTSAKAWYDDIRFSKD